MERFGEGSPGFSMISSQLFTVKITYFLEKEIIFDQFIQQHKLGKIREIQIGNRLETALSDIFRWEIQWLKRHHREFGDGYCQASLEQIDYFFLLESILNQIYHRSSLVSRRRGNFMTLTFLFPLSIELWFIDL